MHSQAATMDPMKYATLNSEVMIGRSLGYASSPMSALPATIQVGMPKPKMTRAAM